MRVGIVGLGIMGNAYARHLLGAGHTVTGFDVSAEAIARFRDLGGTATGSNAEVAQESDLVLVALSQTDALKEAVSSAGGLLDGTAEGQIVVEMGTFPIGAKEEARAALAPAGVATLDAPVSGTGLQAEEAEIVVYASGDPDAIAGAMPVFDVIAKATYDLGEFGNGSKMKYVANLLVSVHNLATAEAFALGIRAGLDPEQILEVISAGVGSSRIFEIRGPMMVADEYPPAARLRMFLKDIDVIGEYARSLDVPTPLLDASLPWYQEGVDQGLGDLDAAALARLLAERP